MIELFDLDIIKLDFFGLWDKILGLFFGEGLLNVLFENLLIVGRIDPELSISKSDTLLFFHCKTYLLSSFESISLVHQF